MKKNKMNVNKIAKNVSNYFKKLTEFFSLRSKKKLFIMAIGLIILLSVPIILLITSSNKSYATATYLYDKVKTDATTNGYGGTYSGDHADSVEDDGTEIVGDEAIYYYTTSGHNNVHFAGFCWQIIRTTDTGGVKLIYNGAYSSSTKCNNSGTARQLSSTSAFNPSYNNRIYVGYKYKSGSTYNATNSTIKTAIDSWYSSNMTSYTSQLEDIVFCNDRTGSTSSGSAATGTTWAADSSTSSFYYHNYSGSYNKLSCYDKRDRFTTNNTQAQLTYPVALATQSEFKLMDSTTKNTGQYWWLLSPYFYNGSRAVERNVNTSGDLDGYNLNNAFGVRPVVSLAPSMTYVDGNGSVSSPYEVEEVQLPERTSSSYLYDVVEQDATEYKLGGTYTDEHADTVEDDGTAIVGDEKIYYYNKKGYNNVKLGNFCWQIIRTTDTGGVKLIYNGTYSSSTKCNNSGTARQLSSTSEFNASYTNRIHVGYMYKSGSTYNIVNSTIKTAIDNWYSSNMTGYTSQLEDTVFCSDRTGSTDSSSAATGTTWAGDLSNSGFYYHNYDSTYNKLSCDNAKDRFARNNSKAQITYPVGLATQPEYLLMDSTTKNTGTEWWLLSPFTYDGGAAGRFVHSTDSLSHIYVTLDLGVRPVVSLKPDIKYSSGTGTISDPYIIDSVGTRVKYSVGSYGTLSGTASEEVSSGGHPTGRDVTPNSGYTFIGWVANKNVTLSNNTTISKGTVMTKAQTQSIVLSSSITLTAKYYKGWLYDKVEQDATTNGYGGTYTGDHADTVQNNGTEIVGNKAIYYYNVAGHNNVKLGDFCWQIIRTTDTGGIKLIYNGTYSSSTKCNNSGTARQLSSTSIFNTSSNNRIYVGYKYKTTNYNDTDSKIKTYIDGWYEDNLLNYEGYLEDTVFCNDRTGSTTNSNAATGTTWAGDSSTSSFYYHNYDDTYNKLFCTNKKDRFATNNSEATLSYPVGLATQPEVLLMDSTTKNTGQYWWLLSPDYVAGANIAVRIVYSNGTLYASLVNYETDGIGVRPVVSLAPNTAYVGGGTATDPYDVSVGVINPEITATFYYQSSSTSGTTNISSVTTSCTPSGGSCSAEIPSAVRSSVGTYNNSYAGLNTSTGSMSTPVGSSATTVTLTSDTTYYAVYRSSVTNYYYSN